MVAEPAQVAYYKSVYGDVDGLAMAFDQNLNIVNLAQVLYSRVESYEIIISVVSNQVITLPKN